MKIRLHEVYFLQWLHERLAFPSSVRYNWKFCIFTAKPHFVICSVSCKLPLELCKQDSISVIYHLETWDFVEQKRKKYLSYNDVSAITGVSWFLERLWCNHTTCGSCHATNCCFDAGDTFNTWRELHRSTRPRREDYTVFGMLTSPVTSCGLQ